MYTIGSGHLYPLTGAPVERTTAAKLRSQSMDAFLESIEKKAYVIAYAACKDQQAALDIVQDAMFSMVKNYSKKPAEQWNPLFFRVLQNRITDQHRKRGFGRLVQWFGNQKNDESDAANAVDAVDAVDQLPDDNQSPDQLAGSVEINEAIGVALSTLSQQQQQVLMLRLWQGLSVAETAHAMDISEGSVKTHLSRAVQHMRRQLQEYQAE